MPQITLEVVSFDGQPVQQPRSHRFDERGGNIGRDESNSFVLSDPHRRVSRLHAAVVFSQGVASLTNASTSLPVVVDGHELDCGRSVILKHGAMVEIGPFLLRAVLDGQVTTHLMTARQADPPAAPASAPAPSVLPAAAPDPFDLVRASAAPPAAPAAAQGGSFGAPLPVDFDPFADLLGATPAARPLTPAPLPGAPLPLPSGAQRVDPALAPFSDPLAALGVAPVAAQRGAVDDPLAAFGINPASPAPPTPKHPGLMPSMPSAAPSWSATPSVAPAPVLIPEDFNPFELPSQTPRNSADPLAELQAAQQSAAAWQAEPSIDALFAAPGSMGSGLDPFGLADAARPADLLAPSGANADPLAMFGPASGAFPANAPAVRDDVFELASAYQPPRPMAPPEPVRQAPAMPQSVAPAPAGYAPDALTAAFLQGAGLTAQALPQGLTPEVMTLVGRLLRNAATGAVEMLAARAATKRELQAGVTIISAQANNPLKFLPDPHSALQQLLHPKMPGFMRGDDAMKDAFDDLRAHEIGVIAGTRAALAEVLMKFDPNGLDERLTKGSFLANLLPSVRKTRLWDVYLERYAQIRAEAEDDFQSIFGRAFVEAYEKETTRIRNQTRAAREAP
jgi:FHA domain-containing protein